MEHRQKNFRYRIINDAAKRFELTIIEAESLANKAGLSLCADKNFKEYFSDIINKYSKKQKLLLDSSNITERMFQYIKNGMNPSKETLLAIAITLRLNLKETQILLNKAGYSLSRSIPSDMVILYLMKHQEQCDKSIPLLLNINITLEELDLPLLMTRWKK